MFDQNALITALPVILSLVVLESLLSIDNALVLAAMVMHLPETQRKWALRAGMIGAYVMRGLALAFVFVIIANPWIKLVAGAYLIYLMCSHLGVDGDEDGAKQIKAGFWGTVVAVELADMTFSIDNIAAAAAFSNKIWIILTGVFIGIAAMRFVAGIFVKLIERFPILATVAYMLVGWVGIQLWAEHLLNLEFTEAQKMGSVLAIVGVGLAYENIPGVSTVLGPIARVGQRGCGLVTKVVEAVNPLRLLRTAD